MESVEKINLLPGEKKNVIFTRDKLAKICYQRLYTSFACMQLKQKLVRMIITFFLFLFCPSKRFNTYVLIAQNLYPFARS